jgi:tight adherence protein B
MIAMLEISGHLAVYLMTFVATVAIVWVFWSNLVEAARASAERIDADRAAEVRTEDIGAPLDRFVSGGRLFRLRLTFAVLPGAAVFGILFFLGIERIAALVFVPLLFAVVGSFLPLAYYRARVKSRQARFETDILDFVTGIGNALRAGMALPQSLEKISAQMAGPMREELQIVLREYHLGIDLVRALDRMSRRMPCEDMRLIVSAVKLTTEAGGSLASVLAEMTTTIRGRREFADKVKALTAEGRFEAAAMSCAPLAAFVFLHLIQPELMRPLYTTGIGWCTLGAVVALEVAGYFTIRKIVTIEV